MDLKKIIKRLALFTAIFSVGLIGTNLATTQTSVAPAHIVASASTKSNNQYWANRVNNFAKTRELQYHPSIGYNFRSIGGLPTKTGKYQIKNGQLFRANNLHTVNKTGCESLKDLNVKTDIDLRYPYGSRRSIHNYPGPGEQGTRNPYRLHMHYINYPVQTYSEERNPYNERMYHRYGEPYDFKVTYVTPVIARRSYHRSLIYIMNHYHRHQGIMYNCTQGRDRTGVLSIILESILGVSKKNIYNDFLLTNHYTYQSSYSSQVKRINDFYKSIRIHYRNMYRYIHYGLYMKNWEISKLRREYLEPITTKTIRRHNWLMSILNHYNSLPDASSHKSDIDVLMNTKAYEG